MQSGWPLSTRRVNLLPVAGPEITSRTSVGPAGVGGNREGDARESDTKEGDNGKLLAFPTVEDGG